jgi:hypothetical protein
MIFGTTRRNHDPKRSIEEMKKKLPEDLKISACTLAEEIRKGEWDRQCNKSLPIPRSQKLIEELESRTPGFKRSEYESALALGMYETR